MDDKQHYRFLENMYKQAPIVKTLFPASQIQVSNGFARIEWPIEEKFHHGAASLHGSAYFRMLDDAAYFAASSRETAYFLVTASFEIQFLRPVSSGLLRAEGRIIEQHSGRHLSAEAVLFSQEGKIVAKGSGTFARSRQALPFTGSGFQT